jgi:hypothetical protein
VEKHPEIDRLKKIATVHLSLITVLPTGKTIYILGGTSAVSRR